MLRDGLTGSRGNANHEKDAGKEDYVWFPRKPEKMEKPLLSVIFVFSFFRVFVIRISP
jgi:hypothetical protein